MIHPNFSHLCRTPSSSPYPRPRDHYHRTHHPYQTCRRYHLVNHPNHRHPLINPQSSPLSPSHGTSIIGNTPQWRCTKSQNHSFHMNPMSLEATRMPCPQKSPLLYHGKSTLPQIVLCPASTPYHPQVPLQRPYANAPVKEAVTSQSPLLPRRP